MCVKIKLSKLLMLKGSNHGHQSNISEKNTGSLKKVFEIEKIVALSNY